MNNLNNYKVLKSVGFIKTKHYHWFKSDNYCILDGINRNALGIFYID